MKKLILTLAIGIGFFTSALTAEIDSAATSVLLTNIRTSPPERPDGDKTQGEDTPPDKPDGGGESGGTSDSVSLKGVLQLDSGSASYDGGTLTSSTSDENVILVQSNACLTVSNYTLNKSGDTSSEDNSNFFALNAVVASKTGGTNYLDHCVLNSNAEGANFLFASGEGSTIYAYNCTLTSTKDSSRGLDATYEGTVIASKMTINTTGDHCAALATDRGNGYISATDSTLSTAGQGSALIYSTGIIEANGVTGTATGAQIAGIEGLSTIRIKNSTLSGSGKKASEPVVNGVIIYQSMSGDSTEGIATFEVSESTLKSAITNGAMFYITNSKADITVQNTALDFDSTQNCLIKAAGNDGSHGWGTEGANGAEVTFTALDQTLTGNISVDGISYLDMYLVRSTYTGTFVKDTTYTGNGGVNLFIDADSSWIVTADCTLSNLTVTTGAKIVDSNQRIVSVVSASGTKLVSGTSDLTITVVNYTSGNVEAPHEITAFEIDRSAFEAMYNPLPDPIAAGEASTQYDTALTATNIAEKINANKDSCITIPTGVESSLKSIYLSKVEATVTSDNRVIVSLTSAAQSNEQAIVDAAITNETIVASLTSTNSSTTITSTTPGLYYWIKGGTDINAVTGLGQAVLSTNGGSIELTKPTLDTTKGQAFFKIATDISTPTQSSD